MTEWSIRHCGRGVMVYWHVETKAVCIYSQLKTMSSSEVTAMIEGVLRHCTDMTVQKNYVDSHGQSEVAFAFCYLLGFQLLPRLKQIGAQRLYLPEAETRHTYPTLHPVLTRAIDWTLIAQQYDQMIKHATALRLGAAVTEAILRRFTKSVFCSESNRAAPFWPGSMALAHGEDSVAATCSPAVQPRHQDLHPHLAGFPPCRGMISNRRLF